MATFKPVGVGGFGFVPVGAGAAKPSTGFFKFPTTSSGGSKFPIEPNLAYDGKRNDEEAGTGGMVRFFTSEDTPRTSIQGGSVNIGATTQSQLGILVAIIALFVALKIVKA